ncbi:MAG: hypothetical protein LC772_06835 [Chloroflexi bacterium]|nr:hypothetical protein [Chloroflexota bacterium]
MMDSLVAKDDPGIRKMLASGSLFMVPAGTSAKYIDNDFKFFSIGDPTRVRIIGGDHNEDDGWIPGDWFHK